MKTVLVLKKKWNFNYRFQSVFNFRLNFGTKEPHHIGGVALFIAWYL